MSSANYEVRLCHGRAKHSNAYSNQQQKLNMSGQLLQLKKLWLLQLLKDLATDVITDSLCMQARAIKLIKNTEFHLYTKHIEIKYHFVRDLYKKVNLI